MRKLKRIISMTVILAICCSLFFTFETNNVYASSQKVENFVDKFSSPTLSSNWAPDGVSLKTGKSVLRLINLNQWEPSITLQKFEITKSCAIQFDLNVVSGNAWLGTNFGLASTGSTLYESKLMLMSETSSVLFWNGSGTSLIQDTTKTVKSTPLSLAQNGSTVTIKYVLTSISDGNFDIDMYWGEQGTPLTKYSTYTDIAATGYFGFCSMGTGIMDIMNFKYYDGVNTTPTFQDDFSSGSMSYPASPDATTNWKVTHIYDKTNVYCGPLYSVSFDNQQTAKLTCTTPISVDKRVELAFDISFEANISTLTNNTYFGIGFGMGSPSAAADSNNFIGFCSQTSNGATSILSLIKNGQDISKYDDGGIVYGVGGVRQFRFVGYSNGDVEIYIDGNDVSRFTGVNFNGYFTLGAVTLADTTSVGNLIQLDNFTLDTYVYATSTGKDTGINFLGTKTTNDSVEQVVDHYINTENWYFSGTGVMLPIRTEKKYMQFIDATGPVAFGPKATYSEFVLRFDLVITEIQDTTSDRSGWIGVSMGRKYIDSNNTDSSLIYFYTPKATAGSTKAPVMSITGVNASTADGTGTVASDLNFWQGNDTDLTTYNVMMVVSGGTADMYFKKSTDDVSQMGILRAHFTDIDSAGYVAVVCNTTGAVGNFRLSNFSITNISPEKQ